MLFKSLVELLLLYRSSSKKTQLATTGRERRISNDSRYTDRRNVKG